ncbi:unnamed protein product [Nesidiocoris tenuis]|uniref:Uncharacterized protein n=1 Tax=Nesidiocoris tenuis TaxID=355587 RepID=A0A6H5H7H9_9HEMI|nr:unnamed protein product [Nesidiocoris tenuis]
MGHMSPATSPGSFVVPHFAIVRDSPTSPVRVVFDGSCRDTSGLSLNDRLLTGPPLQKRHLRNCDAFPLSSNRCNL